MILRAVYLWFAFITIIHIVNSMSSKFLLVELEEDSSGEHFYDDEEYKYPASLFHSDTSPMRRKQGTILQNDMFITQVMLSQFYQLLRRYSFNLNNYNFF